MTIQSCPIRQNKWVDHCCVGLKYNTECSKTLGNYIINIISSQNVEVLCLLSQWVGYLLAISWWTQRVLHLTAQEVEISLRSYRNQKLSRNMTQIMTILLENDCCKQVRHINLGKAIICQCCGHNLFPLPPSGQKKKYISDHKQMKCLLLFVCTTLRLPNMNTLINALPCTWYAVTSARKLDTSSVLQG